MQIPIKSKIPKIISGIAVTISIIALGWFSLSQFWFWVSLEIIAALLVAIGCSGEWWLHHHPAGRKRKDKDEHHKLESRFIAIVALGVIMEFFALGHSIIEGKKLENEVEEGKVLVAAIGTTNSQLVADNLVLRSNVANLEIKAEQTKNSVAKMAPLEQPVLKLYAEVRLRLGGLKLPALRFPARLEIGNSRPSLVLSSESAVFSGQNSGLSVEYKMVFNSDDLFGVPRTSKYPTVSTLPLGKTTKGFLDGIDSVSLHIFEFPKTNASLAGSIVTLFGSDRVIKTFNLAPFEIKDGKGTTSSTDSSEVTVIGPQ